MSRIAQDVRRAVLEGAQEGLLDAAQAVHDQAAEGIGTGDPAKDPDPSFALAEHGSVTADPGGRSVVVEFRGPYVVPQHEAMHFEHPRGGHPKFLERALTDEIPDLPDVIASRVKVRLASQGG